jgi:hypothetical protein
MGWSELATVPKQMADALDRGLRRFDRHAISRKTCRQAGNDLLNRMDAHG